MNELEQILKLIREYGLDLVVIVGVAIAVGFGELRLKREVGREREATAREKEIGDEKGKLLDAVVLEMKAHTNALNLVAAGIEERNRIETTMRGRRT